MAPSLARIEKLVSEQPGLTEAELSTALFGDEGHQQRINEDCRVLMNRGSIKRQGTGTPIDPFKYYLKE